MPIDFAAVAALYQEQFLREIHDLKPLFTRLADAIKTLDRKSVEAERATRAFPLLRYRDDALCMTVDARLMPPLPRTPSLGFVDGLADGWQRFKGEIGYVETAVQQEIALPVLLGPILSMTKSVLHSMERFEKPRTDMFDPGNARFSDLFGVANLGWSSLLGGANQDDLRAIARSVGAAVGPFTGTTITGTTITGTTAAPAPPFQGLIDSLDGVSTMMLDVVLLLPLLSIGIDLVVNDVVTAAEVEILRQLTAIESQVYDVRAAIVDQLISATTLGGLAKAALDAAETWANVNAAILGREIPRWTSDLLSGLDGFLTVITAWGKWIFKLIETTRAVFQSLMDLDLMPLLLNALLPSWVVKLLPSPPSLTVDDLIGIILGLAVSAIRDTLDTWLGRAEDILYWTPFCRHYSYKIGDLRLILNTLLSPTPFTYPPDVMPTTPMAGFPDIYEAIFGGGQRAVLLGSIESFGVELRGSVGGLFNGASTMALDLSNLAGRQLDTMATQGSGLQLRRFGADSVALAAGVFGPERDRVRAQQQQPSPLAAAFDEVMAGGGISLAAAMIPLYVGGMRRFWTARNDAREHPTSAHILAKNGRLAMVRVPRLVVNAGGHEPDAALADTLTVSFRAVVDAAYRDGRARMSQLARPLPVPARGGARGG